MAKTIRDEDLRLNIIINGDDGRKQIGELERAIHDTNAKLETLYEKRKKLEGQGKKDTQAYHSLSAQIGKAEKAVDGYREKLAALHRQQSINTMTLSELTSHINRVRAQLSKVDPGTPLWKQLNAELKKSSARLVELRAQSKVTGGTLCTMAERVNRYIGLITAGFATLTGVFSGISRAKAMFQEWDEAIADAMKTTQLSRGEMLELDQALKKLDTRTSQNNLLGLARIAGKLGIEGKDNILQFVSAADKINIALGEDLGDNAEDAIREIGKLVDIFSLSQEFGLEQAMLKTGSAINSLGMASTANEGYIVEFMKRVAGIATNADISIDKMLGLAATLDKYGQMSETSSTAIGQTIMGMFRRTDEFARVAGMSVKEFTQLLNTDANEALIRVLEGVNRGGDGMITVVRALDSLHLQGQRASSVLGTLAQHSEELRNQQMLANQAFTEGTSIIDEANIKNTTATAIMEKRKKDFVDMAVTLGKELTPAINVSLSASTWLLKGLSALVTVGIKYRSILLGLTAAYAANIARTMLKVAWQKLEVFWSAANRAALAAETASLAGATSGTMLLCGAKNLLVLNLKAATVAFKAFWASIGPIGWASLAFGALVGIIVKLKGGSEDVAESMDKAASARQRLDESLKNNDRGLGESIVKIRRLSDEWKLLGGDLDAKKKFIEDNASAFNDLGVSITDVKDAENLLVNNTADFIEAMRLRAEASAAEELAAEAYKNALIEENKLKSMSPTKQVSVPSSYGFQGTVTSWTTDTVRNDDYYSQQDKAAAIRAEANAYYDLANARKTESNAKLQSARISTNTNRDLVVEQPQKYSLSNDEQFLQKRLALKKEYQNSETMTQEEYNAKLLQLEIDALTARLKTNEDSGADRVALEEDLADKLIQQKERQKKQEEKDAKDAAKAQEDDARKQEKINQDIAEMSGDRIAIEKAKYEKLKREYAGNARALEALEKAHKTRLAKIQLDEADKEIDARRDAYEIARVQMLNRHRQEMETFSGSERQRREKRKEHWAELNALDEKYLNEMIATLTNLVDNAQVGDIQIGVELSDADKAKLLKQIEDLRQQLAKLKDTSSSTETSERFGGSFLGLSGDKWKDIRDGNIKGWREWADAVADIVSGLGNQVLELWGSVDKYMSAAEDSQLKEYEKNNDKKKSALEKRLNAGRITEAQYNAEVAAMEAEHEAYKEELELKQAKRQKAMSITESVINTAVGVTKSLTGLPWPINLVAAAATLAMGVAQTALIAATPITTGAEDGGPIGNGLIDVRREQDGKLFRARLNPNKRGFVSSPTVLVAENGTEYVLPHEAVENPTIAPFIEAMESARQHGTLSELDMRAVYPSVIGRANGGYAGYDSSAVQQLPHYGNANNDAVLYRLAETVDALTERLKYPIDANVSLLGPKGFYEQDRRYHKSKTKRYIGQ
ncbi:MAG: phage tail tape measure protein [Alistipes sp.]|nr:phage tail tape measure protein [Alistipes sp.]